MSLGSIIEAVCTQIVSLVGNLPFVGETLAGIVGQICSVLLSLVGGGS